MPVLPQDYFEFSMSFDLIKSRILAQKPSLVVEMLYKGIVDFMIKIAKADGPIGIL